MFSVMGDTDTICDFIAFFKEGSEHRQQKKVDFVVVVVQEDEVCVGG